MSRQAPVQVVITRPVGSAGRLSERLARLGFAPVTLPALSLAAHRGDGLPARLRALRKADAVIAVSAAAVRFARRVAPGLTLPARVAGFAVGAASGRALAGICRGQVLWPARKDSEGLLALPALSKVRNRRIVILAAPGGRSLIADTLRARGASVEVLHVYRRRRARWDRRHRERLANLERPLVLLTSIESMRALLELAGHERGRLTAGTAVVSSTRLARAARDSGFASVRLAAGPDPAALLAALQAPGPGLGSMGKCHEE